MKLGLYCVARYKRENEDAERVFVEYGAPFVEINDDSAAFAVRQSVQDVKDKLDLSLFAIVKIGEFYPDLELTPLTWANEAGDLFEVVGDCSVLFDEVKVDE